MATILNASANVSSRPSRLIAMLRLFPFLVEIAAKPIPTVAPPEHDKVAN